MHAVFVTFSSSATDGEARTVLQQHATAMVDAPALVDVTWIADGSLLGGCFVFADDVAVDDYDCRVAHRQADPMNVAVQRLARRRRGPLAPDRVDHRLVRNAATTGSHEPLEDLPLPPRQSQEPGSVGDLERPEGQHFHQVTL